MSKLLKNFLGGLQILINPRYLRGKVEEINRQIDETSAMNIVANAQIKELKKFAEKYPHDEILNEKIDFINSLPKDDKEDIVELVNMKKEIIQAEVKVCKKCNNSYIYSCTHEKGGTL